MNILEPLKLSETGCLATPLNVHRFIEAMKHAFGARSEITDPKYATNMSRINEFYTKEWADRTRPLLTNVSADEWHFDIS